MNISVISTATPKFQTSYTPCNTTFGGIEKAAQNLGTAGAEAAGKAANKAGISTDSVLKFLAATFETLFKTAKKLGGFVVEEISKGVRKFSSHFKKNGTQPAQNIVQKTQPAQAKADEFMEVIVAGRKFTYRPGKNKLPEGATIQGNTLMLDKDTKNKDPRTAIQKMREAIEIAEHWGKDQ